MMFFGYCRGNALAASGRDSPQLLVGALGMILGGVLYAVSFDWMEACIIPVGQLGKITLPQAYGASP